MRKVILAIIFICFCTMAWLHVTNNNHVYRTLSMTIFRGQLGPEIDELNDFPTREIAKQQGQPWAKSTHYNTRLMHEDLMAKAIAYETTALLVIQNDSLLYEQYFDGYDAETVSNSFSMAKSFTALLIGMALKDELIPSLDVKVGQYVKGYDVPPYDQISLRHLLMMSSGLDFKESYGSLLGWPAKAYYGTDVNATIQNAPKADEPGKVYDYKGGDTQLLGMILDSVLGPKRVSEYATVLWQKLGAESNAYWSLDVPNGMEKVSCCYYATARDFARFGKLCMQFGRWNDAQLIDSSFIAQSMVAAPTLTKTGKQNTQYGFQWWVMKHRGLDIFYARGIKGQYIFCIPAKKMIVVRLGHKRANKKGDELPEDIFDFLDMGLAME